MNKPGIDRTWQKPVRKEELPFGPSSPAGVIIESNAGWRVQRPVVDHDKCIKCLICWTYCPDGVIGKDMSIDLNFCKGCGICAHECPKQAIHMESEVQERDGN